MDTNPFSSLMSALMYEYSLFVKKYIIYMKVYVHFSAWVQAIDKKIYIHVNFTDMLKCCFCHYFPLPDTHTKQTYKKIYMVERVGDVNTGLREINIPQALKLFSHVMNTHHFCSLVTALVHEYRLENISKFMSTLVFEYRLLLKRAENL